MASLAFPLASGLGGDPAVLPVFPIPPPSLPYGPYNAQYLLTAQVLIGPTNSTPPTAGVLVQIG